MPNKHYINGSKWEVRVMEKLTSYGYLCLRSAGSHSPIDVVAFNNTLGGQRTVLLIQCKSSDAKIPDISDLLAKEQYKSERQKYLDGLPLTKGKYKITSNVVLLEKLLVGPLTRKLILWKGSGKQNYYSFLFNETTREWRIRQFKSFSQII